MRSRQCQQLRTAPPALTSVPADPPAALPALSSVDTHSLHLNDVVLLTPLVYTSADLLTFRFFSSRACRSSSSCVSSRASNLLRSCFRRAAIRSLIWENGQQQQQQQDAV
jgi:hypothetical protein